MEEYTIVELQVLQQTGVQTARSLTEQYLERINQIDQNGPALNSVIELNPDALSIAAELDEERQAGKSRGPLHGIPILLKDNIDTADRMTTTAGSLALQGSIALQDAFLVERLRQAGVVLLGKTNLSEWANFRSTHSISGWSSRGGQTRNPYALDRNPCGSSSGSGVAVAANLCAAAVGTETDGSIICPSHANGIVGIKPTLGLVSRSGIIPIAHSQDTAGPMARTVADAAIMLGAMTGIDSHDPASAACGDNALSDYTTFLDLDGLRGARIGVARNYFGFDARVDQIMERCIAKIKEQGATIIDPVKVVSESKLSKSEIAVLLYEFKADLNAYLMRRGLNAPVKSLEEIIRFNNDNTAKVMPYFGQERMLKAQARGPLIDPRYLTALDRGRRIARESIDGAILQYNLQAIIAPTGGPAWMIDLVTGDHYSGGGFSGPTAVAGYPHITVPAGYIFGLPVGISFFAGAWQEPTLIRLAYAYEQASKVRQPPRYLYSVDLKGAPVI
jgi:amidase